MSYESSMLQEFKMPSRDRVAEELLKTLFIHNGVVKEFGTGQGVVNEIADKFGLNAEQRKAELLTVYRKENRLKKSLLWHRLLFRAANFLANERFITRPNETIKITDKKEWMLTEEGFNKSAKLLKIPAYQKEYLPVKFFELQKYINKISLSPRPKNYNPFDDTKIKSERVVKTSIRKKGFRFSVIEAYNYTCAVCGLKLNSPNNLRWEVEAAHIVPHKAKGKDDLWNGIALCGLHHWAFDVGWYTLTDKFKIQVSSKIKTIRKEYGRLDNFSFLESLKEKKGEIMLPENSELYPHENSIRWHRKNIFCE